MDWNAKTRIAGQWREEAGRCSDHIVLNLKSGDLPAHHVQKGSLEVKREVMLRDALPMCFFCRAHLGWEMHVHPWEDLRYTKYGLRTEQIKMIGQRKPRRNAPCKCRESTTQQLSLPLNLSTSPVLLFLLIHTILVSLLSIFEGVHFCQAEGPGPWPLV